MGDRAVMSRRRIFIAWRIAWTLLTLITVESLVCALSILPVVVAWYFLQNIVPPSPAVRLSVWSIAIVPSYVAFALILMVIAPGAARLGALLGSGAIAQAGSAAVPAKAGSGSIASP